MVEVARLEAYFKIVADEGLKKSKEIDKALQSNVKRSKDLETQQKKSQKEFKGATDYLARLTAGVVPGLGKLVGLAKTFKNTLKAVRVVGARALKSITSTGKQASQSMVALGETSAMTSTALGGGVGLAAGGTAAGVALGTIALVIGAIILVVGVLLIIWAIWRDKGLSWGKIFTGVLVGISGTLIWLGGIIGGILSAIGGGVGSLVSGSISLLASLGGAVMWLINGALTKLAGTPAWLMGLFMNFINHVISGIMGIPAAISGAIGSFAGAIGGGVRAAVPFLQEGGVINKSGIAFLHAGETVTPAGASRENSITINVLGGEVGEMLPTEIGIAMDKQLDRMVM